MIHGEDVGETCCYVRWWGDFISLKENCGFLEKVQQCLVYIMNVREHGDDATCKHDLQSVSHYSTDQQLAGVMRKVNVDGNNVNVYKYSKSWLCSIL